MLHGLLLTSSGIGRRNVWALRLSVGEVRRAPVIAVAPILWTEASRSITLTDPLCASPLVLGGGHQTSIAYRNSPTLRLRSWHFCVQSQLMTNTRICPKLSWIDPALRQRVDFHPYHHLTTVVSLLHCQVSYRNTRSTLMLEYT